MHRDDMGWRREKDTPKREIYRCKNIQETKRDLSTYHQAHSGDMAPNWQARYKWWRRLEVRRWWRWWCRVMMTAWCNTMTIVILKLLVCPSMWFPRLSSVPLLGGPRCLKGSRTKTRRTDRQAAVGTGINACWTPKYPKWDLFNPICHESSWSREGSQPINCRLFGPNSLAIHFPRPPPFPFAFNPLSIICRVNQFQREFHGSCVKLCLLTQIQPAVCWNYRFNTKITKTTDEGHADFHPKPEHPYHRSWHLSERWSRWEGPAFAWSCCELGCI